MTQLTRGKGYALNYRLFHISCRNLQSFWPKILNPQIPAICPRTHGSRNLNLITCLGGTPGIAVVGLEAAFCSYAYNLIHHYPLALIHRRH